VSRQAARAANRGAMGFWGDRITPPKKSSSSATFLLAASKPDLA
jgi:hypothetical protein